MIEMDCPDILIGNTCNELVFDENGHFKIIICHQIVECCQEAYIDFNSYGKL